MPFCHILHQPNRRTFGNILGHGIPTPVMFGTEVRVVEQLLRGKDFDTPVGGIVDKSQMLLDHMGLRAL